MTDRTIFKYPNQDRLSMTKKYSKPTEALKALAVRGPGSKNPKKEIRKWIVTRIERS